MEMYQKVMLKEILSISFVLILLISLCVASFIVIKKMKLDRTLNILVGLILALCLLVGGIHISKCFLDLSYNSFVSYEGVCEFPSRDTIVLNNGEKLYAAISVPSSKKEITIVYAERSKIVVGYFN